MKPVRFLLFVILTMPAAAHAQRVEVGVQAGYFLPAVDQFERSVPRASSTGYFVEHYDARHDPGFAFALALAAWPLPGVGLELAGGVRVSRRDGTSPFYSFPYPPVPAGQQATVSSFALRVMTRKGFGGTTLRLGAGPALVHVGGSAYDGGSAEISLADQTFGGGSFLVDLNRVVGRIRVRIGIEDAVYRVAMMPLAPGDTTRTPLQHDLTLFAGVGLTLR